MDRNAQRASSSSTGSSSSSSNNQRSSSGGAISSNNSWCSVDSAPRPPSPFNEQPGGGPPNHHNHQIDHQKDTENLDDDDDDEYTDFFTNPCVIEESPLHNLKYPSKEPLEQDETLLLYQSAPSPPLLGVKKKAPEITLIFPQSEQEDDHSSPRHNGTSTHISTDSGGASEEEARLSSAPLCSSIQPEHTLSDISGPCSSSLLLESRAPGISERGSTRLQDHEQGAVGGAGCSSAASLPVVLGSTTTSTSSSLSDTDDDTAAEGLRVLGARGGGSKSRHEYDVLPPPPEPGDIEDIVPMTVDTCEDYWTRLHDVRINGCVLEYVGIGNSLHDNGFAQSNVPLTPLNHYFEITILDPGEHCYIAIGLARKDYNMRKNPGWCSGSIAYHTDDGKIFIGGGSGTPFGPRCTSNDILGCGIIFPGKYAELPEGSTWPWEKETEMEATAKQLRKQLPLISTRHRRKARRQVHDNFGRGSSEDEEDDSEDDIWWNNFDQVASEDKVKVFFMRNRKLLGIKEVRIPKNGFYPTIGMMSKNERVAVDLHPLSG